MLPTWGDKWAAMGATKPRCIVKRCCSCCFQALACQSSSCMLPISKSLFTLCSAEWGPYWEKCWAPGGEGVASGVKAVSNYKKSTCFMCCFRGSWSVTYTHYNTIHTYTHTHTHTHTHTRIYVYMAAARRRRPGEASVRARQDIRGKQRVMLYDLVYIYIYIYLHMHVYVCIYIYIHTTTTTTNANNNDDSSSS